MKVKKRAAGKNQARGRNYWPVTYRLTAIGTVVACSAIGTKTMNVASAQGVPQPGGAISQTNAQRFDIAPGPLSELLPQFTRAAGITFTLSTDSIGTIASPGVSGTFTMQDALRHLVEGTGVTVRFTSPAVVMFQ